MIARFLPTTGPAMAAGLLVLGLTTGIAAQPAAAQPRIHGRPATACSLGRHGTIQHVIYLQFDNTHYTRDNPNVPSDLQLMPNQLNFITGNGTLVTHEHTPLIAHTADDSVTSESGLYGAEHGIPIANAFRYYVPGGGTSLAGSFAYWADPMVDYTTPNSAPIGDHSPTVIGRGGRTAPAPWVPFTRSGCSFASVAAANTDLENLVPDVPVVYGANSPQAKEAENPKLANKATADFMGLLVHCARTSAVCSKVHGGRPDVLANEPGGYSGYRARYGNKVIQPVISPSGPVRNLDGAVIKDSSGDVGFPGYNGMIGTNALAYTLDMQTHGVPATYTYLSDLHESWQTGNAFGPGEAGYVHQAKLENARQHALRHLQRRGRSLRRRPAVTGWMQRGQRSLSLQQDRRGQWQPDRPARGKGHQNRVRRERRLGSRALRARPAGQDGQVRPGHGTGGGRPDGLGSGNRPPGQADPVSRRPR